MSRGNSIRHVSAAKAKVRGREVDAENVWR